MAERKEIAEDIKKMYGPMVSMADTSRYLGMCYRKTKSFLSGLPVYDTGKEKCYMAIDIARRLDSCKRMEESA